MMMNRLQINPNQIFQVFPGFVKNQFFQFFQIGWLCDGSPAGIAKYNPRLN